MTTSSEKLNESLISIIIINFNGSDTVLECINSVFKTVNCKFEVILVDNNSKDNSQSICKERFPDIILIQNNKNEGLSARNLGINIAKGNFIVFLDSDTVVEPKWLSLFLESYNEHGVGLYQPKLVDKQNPDIINSAGNMINIFGLAYSRGKGEKDNGQYDNFQKISYTSGACTFTSSKIIKNIGEIDPLFFAYHDDVDYGWRAGLQNYKSYYEPKISIKHQGSRTLQWNSKKFFLLERNRWICLLSLYSRKTLLKIFPLLIFGECGITLYFISKGMGMMKIKALISIIQLNKKIGEKKKKIEKNRKITDKEIIKNFVNEYYIIPLNSEKNSIKRIDSIVSKLNQIARQIINV